MTATAGTADPEDTVVVTDEDDGKDELCIRMEFARDAARSIASTEPERLLVHADDDGRCLLIRSRDAESGVVVGTTLARRFDARDLQDERIRATVATVLVALERYGTVDPREEELRRRCALISDCLLHDGAAPMQDIAVEQALLAAGCPWSEAAARLGGYEPDWTWIEPEATIPETCQGYLPEAVCVSIDPGGRICIRAYDMARRPDEFNAIDAMERLRAAAEMLRPSPFPLRDRTRRKV